MEENNRVIIFEKKEIILILLFVIVLIMTTFTMGIRLGKKLAFKDSGIQEADVKTVELKSKDEEDVEEAVVDDGKLSDDEKLKKMMDESKARLSDELEKLSPEETDTLISSNASESSTSPNSSLAITSRAKFTIQLGSYNSTEEARQFAEGFTVRGYSPILNEIKIEGKGTWFRVCLGTFDTVEEAKEYIKKEQALFSGQDYVITELK